MNLSKLSSPLKSLSLIALTLALSVALQTSALSTWTPATASAPGGNVSTPLNTGLNTQSKLGGLFINTSNTQPFDIGLSVFGKTVLNGDVVIATGSPAAGKVLTALDTNGTVGWGTATGGGNEMVQGVCPSGRVQVGVLNGGVVCQTLNITAMEVVDTFPHGDTAGDVGRKGGGWFPASYDLAAKDPSAIFTSGCGGWCWFQPNGFMNEICAANGFQKVKTYGYQNFSNGKNNPNVPAFDTATGKFYLSSPGGRIGGYLYNVTCSKINSNIYLAN